MPNESHSRRIARLHRLFLLALVICVSMLSTACGGPSTEGSESSDVPIFEANPSTINFSNTNIGESAEQIVEITNAGTGTLELSEIELHDNSGDAFSTGSSEWPGEASLEADESITFSVVYEPTDTQIHSGFITMQTNDPNFEDGEVVIEIRTPGVSGELLVETQHVDFSQVPVDSSEWKIVEIQNISGSPLNIDDIFVNSGEDEFSISFPAGRTNNGGLPPIDDDADSAPDELAAGDEPLLMRVLFEPTSEDPVHGDITLLTNDSDSPEFQITLAGNSDEPCLDVSNSDGIEFGPASMNNTTHKTLTLRNCSPVADLDLTNIEFSDDGGVFSLDTAALPSGLPDDTHMLGPGDVTTATVTYHPTSEISHIGELTIESTDRVNPNLSIPISGTGVDGECPVAQATGVVNDGAPSSSVSAAPQQIVEFSSTGSTDPDGTDLSYEWSIISRPSRSRAGIHHPTTTENPFFDIDIVGTFLIELTVYDEMGLANCDPAIIELQAAPTGDIHVQLTWDTPAVDATYGGPDGTEGFGTDLDLYYVSPDGTWTDSQPGGHAINFNNTSAAWGTHGDATLDIDDYWGKLPENITHTNPADGGEYRVGVHYYSDKSWGPSDAMVRVYFGTNLYDQYERRLNDTDNFWDVGAVQWGNDPTFDFVDLLEQTHPLPSAGDMGWP